MDLNEIDGGEDWFDLTQVTDSQLAGVNTAMGLCIV